MAADAAGRQRGGAVTQYPQRRPEVVYVLPNKLGGVFSYVHHLLSRRRPDDFSYAAVRTQNARDRDHNIFEPLEADRDVRFEYSLPPENIHAVLRRLALTVPFGPGVVVANDWIELALTSIHDTGRAVYAINHGDMPFYYDLAVRHQDTIDAFVTYTDQMARRLRELLPHRQDSIFLLPYGVDIPATVRQPAPGKLRLLYVGRLSADKGVFDLPFIDRRLKELGVDPAWTVQGGGPDEAALRASWPDRGDIRWFGQRDKADVLRLYEHHDVLVMPSRHEGLPVTLLEAGAAGVVPVVSDLASGIPEVVQPGVSGYRPAVGQIGEFAEAIAALNHDRTRLEAMSRAVRDVVATGFDATERTAGYQRLFARWRELKRPRPKHPKLHYGSRLDKPWIPNVAVRLIRSALSRR
jgi:glycosyltransferase involved in cell wall biosynthesis